MPQILYNKDHLQDAVFILAFINDFTTEMGIDSVVIDTSIIERVVNSCRQDFPCKDGIEKASVFKKVANFVCFFIGERPILEPFPKEVIGDDLAKIDNHQNAMIAFEIAKVALHGSIIQPANGDIEVMNEISVSQHSYIDILDALSNITPVAHFKVVSVLLEQLVYKTNPGCQYPAN